METQKVTPNIPSSL